MSVFPDTNPHPGPLPKGGGSETALQNLPAFLHRVPLLNWFHRRRYQANCPWLSTRNLAVRIVSRRVTTTTRKAYRLSIATRKLIASIGQRCSSFRATIQPFPASSRTASTSSRVGAIRFVVERCTTDGPCARQGNFRAHASVLRLSLIFAGRFA